MTGLQGQAFCQNQAFQDSTGSYLTGKRSFALERAGVSSSRAFPMVSDILWIPAFAGMAGEGGISDHGEKRKPGESKS